MTRPEDDTASTGWAGVTALVRSATDARTWRVPDAAPAAADDAPALDRRGFFQWLGTGVVSAGLAACTSRPARQIKPYVHQPPELTPGIAQHYATALVEDGFATGVVVETHEGRPTKLEGNPDHPASLGATRAIEQAAVLSLYDPQRIQGPMELDAPTTWPAIERWLASLRVDGGAGLHVVLEPTTSPVVIALVTRLRATLPGATVTFWAPLAARASLAGHALAFGRPLQAHLDLAAADVLVTLDADLVGDHPMALAYSRQIADRRRVTDAASPMSRIYALEPAYTATGLLADHRFAVRGGEIEGIATQLFAAVGAPGASGGGPRWLAAIAADLRRSRGRSLVVAGERQPAAVHALAAAINAALGNVGATVRYSEPVAFEAGQASHGLDALRAAFAPGAVRARLVLGGNPVYTAPAGVDVAAALAAGPSLYLGLYANETGAACRYVAPGLHALEQWDLARAYDGTLTPIQPLIEPLFDGRAVADVLAALLGDAPALPRDRVRDAWRTLAPASELDAALALGCARGTAAAVVVAVSTGEPAPARPPIANPSVPGAAASALELDLRPHPFVYDGRYANNPWLLELPEPITKLTWDNAAEVSPATAARLGLATGTIVALATDAAGTRTLEVPAIVVPGHADDSLTLHLGFGRAGAEHVARAVGVRAFALWDGAFQTAVAVTRRDAHRDLAITQETWGMDHRPLALGGTLSQLAGDAWRSELARHRGEVPSLLAKFPMPGEQWAMSIDLTTCSGCTACVMACAAENNTPVVGREQVLRGRAMHWLRIDRYVEETGPSGPRSLAVQPMLCQHCEAAPCEYVCPVEATVHSPDGLNEMVYNRCVGTRFCSNNCPYKVRRFNWFDFKQHDGLQILARNPDVTVRDRGVMEKCTYCVQRIRRVEIDARVAGRPIAAGEVRTACQQACPTQAIAFGSITNAASSVTEQRRRPHSYEVLHDQGTRPRTTYLARIRNPNPELA